MPAQVFTIEEGQVAFAVVDRQEVGYSDAWQAPHGLFVDTVTLADYSMPVGSEWRCQITSGMLTASPNTATRDVPATFCGPGRTIPQVSETSYSLDVEWLQDPQIAEGLSRFLFEHDTEEAYFFLGLTGPGIDPPKAIGRVRLVAGTFGGAPQENLTASVSLELTQKPQIMFGTAADNVIIPPNGAGPVPATGATAGTPGTWTPGGSTPPATVAALQASSIVASPATAWTTGQWVDVGDGSDAYWDGDTWEPGTAP